MLGIKQLSKKQEQVLRFILSFQNKNHQSPTLKEISEYLDISIPTAYQHVEALSEKNFIKRKGNEPRSIAINPQILKNEGIKPKYLSIPVLGAANAGAALLNAEECTEGYLRVPTSALNSKKDIFAIRVEGDSMNKADVKGKNIENQDFVLINPEIGDIKNDDYVLCVIDGFGTVKKIKKDKKTGGIKLIPESTNPKHKPIFISSEDNFVINGKVIGVIKK